MTAAALPVADYRLLSIAALVESAKNPRKHFDPAKLQELAASIREHGVLTPLLAREVTPDDDGPLFELAAGHRRFRAAQLAGLTEVPVVVREMTDTQLLEVLTIENLQRDDVHALEEAQGYADLIKEAGYDVQRIADRIGKSVKYVYDRVKLLQLIPELQDVFFDGKITAGHAIILARLTRADQARALDYQHGGVWGHDDKYQTDLADIVPQHELKGFGAVQAKSVRQLQHWVDTHVRIDVTRDADAQLFPDLAAVAAPALEASEKVVAITHHLFVHPDAKNDGERTYGPATWKRADGKQKSKTCDYSAIGVVVVGEERGTSYRVCVNKNKCRTHWGAAIAAREKRASGATPSTPAAAKSESWQEQQDRQRAEAERAAFATIAEKLLPALLAHIKKAPAGGRSLVAEFVLESEGNRPSKKAAALLGRGTSAEDLLRHVAFGFIHEGATNQYWAHHNLPEYAKALGFDYARFVKSFAPAKPAQHAKAAEKKAPAKKKARR